MEKSAGFDKWSLSLPLCPIQNAICRSKTLLIFPSLRVVQKSDDQVRRHHRLSKLGAYPLQRGYGRKTAWSASSLRSAPLLLPGILRSSNPDLPLWSPVYRGQLTSSFRMYGHLTLPPHSSCTWTPQDFAVLLLTCSLSWDDAYTGQQETLLPCQALVPTQLQRQIFPPLTTVL